MVMDVVHGHTRYCIIGGNKQLSSPKTRANVDIMILVL
jgi:hypothetical protein